MTAGRGPLLLGRRRRGIIWLPVSLAGLAFVSAAGPWGAFVVADSPILLHRLLFMVPRPPARGPANNCYFGGTFTPEATCPRTSRAVPQQVTDDTGDTPHFAHLPPDALQNSQ